MSNTGRIGYLTATLSVCAVLIACAVTDDDGKQRTASTGDDATKAAAPGGDDAASVEVKPLDAPAALHNVYAFGPDLINGSAPEGDEAFAALKKLGVKTIISVEAAAPDIERARANGIRYVHVPIGYDTVPREAGMQMARAVRDLPGPVYIHCYHGKHRSPAAAAYLMVLTRKLTTDDAIAAMKLAGVGEKYPGLYACVREATPAAETDIDAVPADLPEVARTDSVEAAMAKIGRHWDFLKLFDKNDWRPIPDHPDLAIERETEVVADLFETLARDSQIRADHDEKFNAIMDDGYAAALALKRHFNRDSNTTDADAAPATDPREAMQRLAASCSKCHKDYRN